MRIFCLFLIFYTFSISEQKPFDKYNSNATDTVSAVIPLISDLDNSDQKLSSALNDDTESTRDDDNIPTITDSGMGNSDKTNIFKIPLAKSKLISADVSNVSTTPNSVKEENQGSSNATVIPDIDESVGTLTTSASPSIDNMGNKDSTDEKFIPDVNSTSSSKDVAVTGSEMDHILSTSIPSSVASSEVKKAGISVLIEEVFLPPESNIEVIPLKEHELSADFESTISASSNNVSDKNDKVSSTTPTISDDTIKTTSPRASQDNLIPSEDLATKAQQNTAATNLMNNKTRDNSRLLLLSAITDPPELLIAEETLSSVMPEHDDSASSSIEKDVEDLIATNVTSPSATTTNTTEVIVLSNTAEEILIETTDLNFELDSTTASTLSTSITESVSLKKEKLESELLIQDLLDPLIVLAKRSLSSSHDIRNPSDIPSLESIYRGNQGRLGQTEETRPDSDYIKETSARARRNAWCNDYDNTYDDSWWYNRRKPSYVAHHDYKERRFDVDDEVRSGSRSPPFKLIPVFSG